MTRASFTPYRATTAALPPICRAAVVAYEGDIDTLAGAGGEIVGTLEVRGNGFTGRSDVRARASSEAAQRGGTHVLVAGEGSSTTWTQTTPTTATTRVYGNTATTTVTPGTVVPVSRPHGGFVIVRVPPEKWLYLPQELRPVP